MAEDHEGSMGMEIERATVFFLLPREIFNSKGSNKQNSLCENDLWKKKEIILIFIS